MYRAANMPFNLINSETSAAGAKGTTTNNNLAGNALRPGFKDSESLCGVLVGKWQVESAVAIDNAGGTLAPRNSFAVLTSK